MSSKIEKEAVKELALEQIDTRGKVDPYILSSLKMFGLLDWYLKRRDLKEKKPKPKRLNDKQRLKHNHYHSKKYMELLQVGICPFCLGKLETPEERRDSMKKIARVQYKVAMNTIRLSVQNRDSHELVKYLICRQLNEERKMYATECYLTNGMRVDVLVLDDRKIIEILDTETQAEFQEKKAKLEKAFGGFFEIVSFRVEDALQEGWDLTWNPKLIY